MLAAAVLQAKQVIISEEKTNNTTHKAMFLSTSKQSLNNNGAFS